MIDMQRLLYSLNRTLEARNLKALSFNLEIKINLNNMFAQNKINIYY